MKRLLAIALLLGLGACANDETIEPPAELVEFQQRAEFDRVWTADVGDLNAELYLGLVPATDGTNLYAADHDGDVHAFRLSDGKRVWQHETGEFTFWGDSNAMRFSAGPSVADGRVVVGSLNGDVLALDASTGEPLWQANVNGELLAAPLQAAGLVVLRTTDGRLVALDGTSGEPRWETVREVPPLTIRGLSAAATDGQRIYAGFDNGKVAALNIADGSMIWEATIATPVGASDLEGIVDVDGDIVTFGQEVYATSYNGHLAALAAESGEILWRRETSSVLAPTVSWGDVFATDINSVVRAHGRLSGATVWMQDKLRARYLTAPAVFGDLVVLGDFEGYLHFLDITNGEMQARIQHAGEPVRAQPLVVDDLLIVLSDDGELAAYRRTDRADAAASE